MNEQNADWERKLIHELAGAALAEQRRARQWKIFFRLMWLGIILLIVLGSLFGDDGEEAGGSLLGGGHTAVIKLDGVIEAGNDSFDKLSEGLNAAYKSGNTRGIIISANSPGGSPALSGMGFDEIRRQRSAHPRIPVYVVVQDVCASGCYYIAAAADKIFVDKASIIGSIGVISSGFGFDQAIKQLGIQRRLMTAGTDKALGDPFSPENPHHEAIRRELINGIHQQFIAAVQAGRGKRLKQGDELFTGRVWLGSQSIPLGLADGYGSVNSVARDVIKAEKLVDYTPKDGFGKDFARRFGTEVGTGLFSSLMPKLF